MEPKFRLVMSIRKGLFGDTLILQQSIVIKNCELTTEIDSMKKSAHMPNTTNTNQASQKFCNTTILKGTATE